MKKFCVWILGFTAAVIAVFILYCGGTEKAAAQTEDFLEDMLRDENTPSYLTLYYRRKHLLFAVKPHAPHPIVFFGDSMTDRGDWDALFPDVPLINLGIGGDTTDGLLNRIDQVTAMQPPKIFLMIGTNDLCFYHDIPTTLENYDKILSILHKELPDTTIYIESVLPFNETIFPEAGLRTNNNILKLNEVIKKLAEKYNDTYLDITPDFTDKNGSLPADLTVDGLHLNQKGYELWRDKISNYVKS